MRDVDWIILKVILNRGPQIAFSHSISVLKTRFSAILISSVHLTMSCSNFLKDLYPVSLCPIFLLDLIFTSRHRWRWPHLSAGWIPCILFAEWNSTEKCSSHHFFLFCFMKTCSSSGMFVLYKEVLCNVIFMTSSPFHTSTHYFSKKSPHRSSRNMFDCRPLMRYNYCQVTSSDMSMMLLIFNIDDVQDLKKNSCFESWFTIAKCEHQQQQQ